MYVNARTRAIRGFRPTRNQLGHPTRYRDTRYWEREGAHIGMYSPPEFLRFSYMQYTVKAKATATWKAGPVAADWARDHTAMKAYTNARCTTHRGPKNVSARNPLPPLAVAAAQSGSATNKKETPSNLGQVQGGRGRLGVAGTYPSLSISID